MKLLRKIFQCASIFLLIIPFVSNARQATPEKIQLSEEDIATLEAMGFSRAEAQETANLINNMSQEEQNALAQIGQQVAQDMTKSGLDPNDPEQMVNFLSKQEAKPAGQPAFKEEIQPIKREERSLGPTPQALEQKIAEPTKNPFATADIERVIKEILKHLASLRQKRQTSEKLSAYAPELDALAVNLEFINRPELFPLITSQEFSRLYNQLTELHRALINEEPGITAFPFFEEDDIDNPYKTLELPTHARPEQVKAAYKKLKQKNNPELLAKSEYVKKLSKKERERELTEAKLNLIEIEAAYESLKNPKEKAAIDQALSEYDLIEKKNEQLSDKAFKRLINEMLHLLQPLHREIGLLLKKYAPEEKKKLDEWEKQKSAALDISKKEYGEALSRGRSPRLVSLPAKEEIGEKFYREYRIPETPHRPSYPSISSEPSAVNRAFSSPFGPEPELAKPSGGAKAPEAKAPGKEKEGGKDKKESKESPFEKAQTAGPSKEAKPKESELSEEDKAEIASLAHIGDLKSVKKLMDEKDTERLFKFEIPAFMTQEPKEIKENEEKKAEIPPTLKKLDDIMQKSHLLEMAKDFSELAKKVSDKKLKAPIKEGYKKLWQEIQTKYKPSIEKLHELVQFSLDPRIAPSRSGTPNAQQQTFQLLNTEDKAQKEKLEKLITSGNQIRPGEEGYLGQFKELVYHLANVMGKITKELGTSKKA